MITAKEQQKLFLDIANALSKKITAYAIGGTAMIFLGLKRSTLDVDIVFANKEDRKTFKEAVLSLGYLESDVRIVYEKRENAPEMVNVAEGRIDLFLLKILTSTYSEEMQKRAVQIHEFAKNLIIKVSDIHDIIIMKAVASREKDEIDILEIIKNSKINWEIIIKEAEAQVELGNTRAVMDLGYVLERIKNKAGAEVPQEVLDTLWKMLKKQIEKKIKKFS